MADLEITIPAGFWDQEGAELVLHSIGDDPTEDGHRFLASRDMLFVVWNANTATEPVQFVVESQPHPDTGRRGDIDVEIEPGEMRIFRLTKSGWADSEGYINIPLNSGTGVENLYVGVVRLRAG